MIDYVKGDANRQAVTSFLQKKKDDMLEKKRKREKSSSSSSMEEISDDDKEDNQPAKKKAKGAPQWSWSGDSKKGHQDVWIKYGAAMNNKLEAGYKRKQKIVKIDNERFVDLQNMLQRRYDDTEKRRKIKRKAQC